MNVRFSDLSWDQQSNLASEENFKKARKMADAATKNTTEKICSALAAFGIVLPDSIKLAGDVNTFLAAVESAAAAKKLAEQNADDGDEGTFDATQMSRRTPHQRLDALIQHYKLRDKEYIRNMPDADAQRIVDELHPHLRKR